LAHQKLILNNVDRSIANRYGKMLKLWLVTSSLLV
jgi:hypothetical protein